ncbi:hypothetical protein ACI7BZ_17110 [Xanthobacter sp. AM11]|uniref:hypothetical protein n=1 Tax=Xanthobacter sp. AM11 TaxID=3380643 RepID=UPI0039BF3BD6
MAEGAHAPLKARIVHQTEGRTRLALAAPATHERLVALADALAACGVEKVEIRTVTGSVILTHDTPWPAIAGAVAAAGLELFTPPPPPPPKDPIGETGDRLSQADLLVTLFSRGQLDVRNAAFLALVVGGLVQLARGRVAGPALTLFGQALTLAVLGKNRPQR